MSLRADLATAKFRELELLLNGIRAMGVSAWTSRSKRTSSSLRPRLTGTPSRTMDHQLLRRSPARTLGPARQLTAASVLEVESASTIGTGELTTTN